MTGEKDAAESDALGECGDIPAYKREYLKAIQLRMTPESVESIIQYLKCREFLS